MALVMFGAGCMGGSNVCPNGPVEVERLRRSKAPYFWVGRTFDGLDLTHTEAYGDASKTVASLIYGRCEVAGGWFKDGAPPLELQHRLCGDELIVVIFVGAEPKPGRAARAEISPANERRGPPSEPRTAVGQSLPCYA